MFSVLFVWSKILTGIPQYVIYIQPMIWQQNLVTLQMLTMMFVLLSKLKLLVGRKGDWYVCGFVSSSWSLGKPQRKNRKKEKTNMSQQGKGKYEFRTGPMSTTINKIIMPKQTMVKIIKICSGCKFCHLILRVNVVQNVYNRGMYTFFGEIIECTLSTKKTQNVYIV